MNDKIFRKKSLDRISSPEQLNDYIKVSNPSVWLIITAVCILLVSAFVWAVRGNITTSVNATGVFLDNNNTPGADIVLCCITDENAQKISKGMAKAIEKNQELEVRFYNKYESTNNYVLGKIETVYTKGYKKEVIAKEFGLTGQAADVIMDNPGAYYVPLVVKLEKDSSSKDGYKWAKSQTADDSLVTEDGLCRVEIITESVTPINFLIGKEV